jgi:hypothetical protein
MVKGGIFQGNLQRAEQGFERVFRTQLFSPLALKFVHPSLVVLLSELLFTYKLRDSCPNVNSITPGINVWCSGF